jgi:hypothetical protein
MHRSKAKLAAALLRHRDARLSCVVVGCHVFCDAWVLTQTDMTKDCTAECGDLADSIVPDDSTTETCDCQWWVCDCTTAVKKTTTTTTTTTTPKFPNKGGGGGGKPPPLPM